MNSDLEEQEDELLALQSIFDSEEFVRNKSKFAGEIRVSAKLPAGFTVVLKEGETVRQYEISFLPPLILTFELPENYPSSSPPSFTLTCSWLTNKQLSALTAQLTDLYQATGGTVVLFSWVQFLREDALKILDIHNLLELPSDQHITHYNSQGPQSAALCEPKCPTDGHNASTSDCSRPNNCANPTEQGFQTSHFEHDVQNDSFSEAHKSKFDIKCDTSQHSVYKEDDVSASSFSHPPDQTGQGAASLVACPRGPPENNDLTPSQHLLSQILIFNVDQKEKEFANTVFDCSVCFMSLLGSDCVQLLDCGHIFCRACLAEFCKIQIKEGTVQGVTCPQEACTARPTPAQVRSLVGEKLFSRYDRLLLQSSLDSMSDVVYCPRRSCESPVILEKSSTAAMCTVCGFAFCVSCRKTFHGPEECATPSRYVNLPPSYEGKKALMDSYKGADRKRRRMLERHYGLSLKVFAMEEHLNEKWLTSNSKSCPHCFAKIEKNGGCNVMTCYRCNQQFCWACKGPLESHGKPCPR